MILCWKFTSSIVTEFVSLSTCFFVIICVNISTEQKFQSLENVSYVVCFQKCGFGTYFIKFLALCITGTPPPPSVCMTALNLINWVLHYGNIHISLHMTSAYYCIILLILYTGMKKLRANRMQGILATTWSKSFCLARFYVKKYKIKILKTIILPVVIWVGNLVAHFTGRK